MPEPAITAQDRRLTELEGAIIAILLDIGRLAHGFEVNRVHQERTGREIGIGTQYKILHRLEREGFLESEWEAEEDRTPHRGPRRRYYRVTGLGEEAYQEYAKRLAGQIALRWRPA